MSAETWKFAPAYELPHWPFVAPPDLGAGERIRYPVVIAGGGLAGLTLACDLALRGVRAVVLDEDDTVGVKGASSRGICYAQKSLEIFDRSASTSGSAPRASPGRSAAPSRATTRSTPSTCRTTAPPSSRPSSTCSSSTWSGSWSTASTSWPAPTCAGRAG
jgi:hypothetical protein